MIGKAYQKDSLESPPPTRRRVPYIVVTALLALVIWALLRVVLWIDLGPGQIAATPTATAFAKGLWFDVWTLTYLITPWILLSIFIPNRWRASPAMKLVKWTLLWIITATLLFGAVGEYVFWQEFTTRFNFITLDYLIYTTEVINNIWQSYPVIWILAGIGAVAGAIVLILHRYVVFSTLPRSWQHRAVLAVAAIVLPVASFGFASIDQMHNSANAYANELSGNGLFTLAAAMRRNELDYDQFYKTLPQAQADAILAGLDVTRMPLSRALVMPDDVAEATELGPFKRHPKNVILVSIESMSAEFVGAYGNKKGLTPNLDRLAREGLRFDRLFATGTRTVRGLEALSLGTPPIPGQSIVRRPGNEHLATIGELLEHQGYSTFFLYGGYGYFDNMNTYFAGNDYKVIDRTDFPAASIPFENVWGVADEALFNNALVVFDKAASKKKPFFAHIMTTSNHRPYTYPDGRIDIPSPGGRDGAIKYTDFAIGQFIDLAKSKPWFDETLFVFVADHCAAVSGKSKLPVANYLIPAILYAPKMLKPGVYTRMASQIDLAPTLLDVLGAKGDDHFFGQSLFESESLPPRAFISNYQELGYYKDDVLTVLFPKQKVEAFHIDPQTFAATPIPPQTALVAEAIAYYQTGSRAFRQHALQSPSYSRK